MAFDSFGEFLAMGNHGFYVWFAYGLTFLIMGALAWHSLSAHDATRRALAAQHRRNASAVHPGEPMPLGTKSATEPNQTPPNETETETEKEKEKT